MAQGRIELLQKMLEQDPGDSFCCYGMAQEYLKLGDIDNAVAWFDRTLASDPEHCYAYFHKARALEMGGRLTEAQATLRTGLERARIQGDSHAIGELQGYLGQLE
ncbi:MAG: tetratricopeptide repeat protein [Planctomycetes bacterium]|nr:tetratricopeptide repeat protein [Planctomycetota bacterium]